LLMSQRNVGTNGAQMRHSPWGNSKPEEKWGLGLKESDMSLIQIAC
jgi:hypothetical protein